MTTRDSAPRVRRAGPADVGGIVALIDSNVGSGELLPRTPEFVSAQLEHFLVVGPPGAIIGCVHLDEYAPSLAEVRSLAVAPTAQGMGVGVALVEGLERLARTRGYATVFAVSNSGEFFRRRGYEERHIPELDRERSNVSRYKGVHAKDLPAQPPVPSRG
ncbi:MAG: putative acetyltransferase [Gemmatimonadetes bacterium]|jgi:amino-acid N-acetyltransferase|nr:putative acetyltransferase [Gemmatimonadota bacterium]